MCTEVEKWLVRGLVKIATAVARLVSLPRPALGSVYHIFQTIFSGPVHRGATRVISFLYQQA